MSLYLFDLVSHTLILLLGILELLGDSVDLELGLFLFEVQLLFGLSQLLCKVLLVLSALDELVL